MKNITALGAALLFAAPAQAVDYVACEAMQRANDRLSAARQRDLAAAGAKVSRDFQNAKCGQFEALSSAWSKCLLEAGFPSDEDYRKVHDPIRAQYAVKIEKLQADYTKAGCL